MLKRLDTPPTGMRYEQVRILLKDGRLSVHLSGGDFVDAELFQVDCGDSLDLCLPLQGMIPVRFKTD